jgi:hypothetical protein
MTSREQSAYDEGKLARLMDERNTTSGSRSRCPYRAVDHVRAWKQGYQDQLAASQPRARTPEDDARVAAFCSAIEAWRARNK